jgi:protein-tyrosine phosphatase
LNKVVNIFDVGDYVAVVNAAAERLRAGGVVVLPTETVYGVAALLTDATAMSRLRSIRANGDVKPFTLHVATPEEAIAIVGPLGEFGLRMIRKLWPGPVAMVFEVAPELRHGAVQRLGVAESDLFLDGKITIRCPDHRVATDVIQRAGGPVVLTLPGKMGSQPPLSIGEFSDEILSLVDQAIDAGPSRFSKPSTIVRVKNDGYEIVREGVYDARIIERLLRTTILFVCSGNTCRSPMAEAIAKRVISDKLHVTPEELEKKGISVISAGSFAMPGARATPQAVDAVLSLGGDLSRHRSRPLTVELIHQADRIFTMGQSHQQAVMALVPSAAEKVSLLDPAGDIDDPIGGDIQLYNQVAGHLRMLIESRVDQSREIVDQV